MYSFKAWSDYLQITDTCIDPNGRGIITRRGIPPRSLFHIDVNFPTPEPNNEYHFEVPQTLSDPILDFYIFNGVLFSNSSQIAKSQKAVDFVDINGVLIENHNGMKVAMAGEGTIINDGAGGEEVDEYEYADHESIPLCNSETCNYCNLHQAERDFRTRGKNNSETLWYFTNVDGKLSCALCLMTPHLLPKGTEVLIPYGAEFWE